MTPSKMLATEDLAADPAVQRGAVDLIEETGDRVVTRVVLELDDGSRAALSAPLTDVLLTLLLGTDRPHHDGRCAHARHLAADLDETGGPRRRRRTPCRHPHTSPSRRCAEAA
jgi:hypothetical protein